MAHVTKNCEACFGVIDVRLSDHKRGWGNFCDKSCAAAYKCGQRPRDVNKKHTEYSFWADVVYASHQELYPDGKPPKQPSVEEQIKGRVKIKHKLHSPLSPYQIARQAEVDEDDLHRDISWDAHQC